jgi:hypothetical protein
MSMPARSMSRIAASVAASCASSSWSGAMRQISVARTRGGTIAFSMARSTSQSG